MTDKRGTATEEPSPSPAIPRWRKRLLPIVAIVVAIGVSVGILIAVSTNRDLGADQSHNLSSLVVHDGDKVAAEGSIAPTSDGRLELCATSGTLAPTGLRSTPCRDGFVAYLAGPTAASARSFLATVPDDAGTVRVTGRLAGDTITGATLSRRTAFTPPPPTPATPCDKPAAGWSPQPADPADRSRVQAFAAQHEDTVGMVWMSDPGAAPDVLTLGTTGDPAIVRSALSQVPVNELCVYPDPISMADLKQARAAADRLFGGETGSSNLLSAGYGLDVVAGTIVRLTDAQAQALAPYADELAFDAVLKPA
jgi:hypothetical protein